MSGLFQNVVQLNNTVIIQTNATDIFFEIWSCIIECAKIDDIYSQKILVI